MAAEDGGRRVWRWLPRLALMLALLVVAASGIFFLTIGQGDVQSARRELRLALGLPKFWVTEVHQDVARHQPVPCPAPADTLMVVTGGQSNAANAYDALETLPPPVPGAVMMWDGRCYGLQSPVLGAVGDERDSLWPALGARLVAARGRPVLFVNGAVSGSQIGDFVDRRSHYLDRLQAQVRGAEALGYRTGLVIWIHGETDAFVQLKPETFVAQLAAVRDGLALRAGATPPRWLVLRSTRCMDRPGNGPALEQAVADWVQQSRDPQLLLGPSTAGLGPEYRRDGCHFNAAGRDRLADMVMDRLTPVLAPAPATAG